MGKGMRRTIYKPSPNKGNYACVLSFELFIKTT